MPYVPALPLVGVFEIVTMVTGSIYTDSLHIIQIGAWGYVYLYSCNLAVIYDEKDKKKDFAKIIYSYFFIAHQISMLLSYSKMTSDFFLIMQFHVSRLITPGCNFSASFVLLEENVTSIISKSVSFSAILNSVSTYFFNTIGTSYFVICWTSFWFSAFLSSPIHQSNATMQKDFTPSFEIVARNHWLVCRWPVEGSGWPTIVYCF